MRSVTAALRLSVARAHTRNLARGGN
jgi:hypothetical protein